MEQGFIKTQEEIKIMRQGGKILAMVLDELRKAVHPGVSTGELNSLAEKLITENGGTPSFKNYQPDPEDIPFPTTLCTSINDEVVHAPALPSRVLKAGDIICLDLGLKYPARPGGLFTDAAITVAVGQIDSEAERLMKVTAESLEAGIAVIRPGNFISDIAKAIQEYVEKNGFSVVRDLVGHGVGRFVHEPPRVPNFFDRHYKPVELKEGMTICLEPMVAAGRPEVKTLDDGWTVVTSDGELSAHFEHTVAITKNGHEILTKL
ncbi:type I methionyl aminopeptidase [Candidatus Falkowbacteria bacterium]|nr:type I methionyl aminopeptidase [Candidatus Falkowbacteria bacterium]